MPLSPEARVALKALYDYVSEVDALGTVSQIAVHAGVTPFTALLGGLEELARQHRVLKLEQGQGYALWALNRVDEAEALLFGGPVSHKPLLRRSALAG